MEKIVILANGEFPYHPIPLSILMESENIICCDGSVTNLEPLNKRAVAIVGDLDTLPVELKKKYSDIVYHDKGQEDNDLTKAFRYSMQFSPKEIIILGATGKREDHTLGNISLLVDYAAQSSAKISMVTNSGVFNVIREGGTFESYPGMQLSLFSIDIEQKVKSEGLKYPLDGVRFDSLWKATLNEVVGESYKLELERESPLLLYSPHKK